MAQFANLTINPNSLSTDILFMEVPNSLGKVEENDYPARFVIPYNGLHDGENHGTLISDGKKTIDVVFTGDGASPSVSLSCLNCDPTVIATDKGKVTEKVTEYLIFNGQSTAQSSRYGGTRSLSEIQVVDESGAMLSAELNQKSGVVLLYKNNNGTRQPSLGYGSVKITHNYSATRFVIKYGAKDFRYFVNYDKFKNAFVSHNGDSLAPDFMKATVAVSGKQYVSIYNFTRKVQNVQVVVGDDVAFYEGEQLPPDSSNQNPANPANPANIPTKPVKINPYSQRPQNTTCKSKPPKTKTCFDGSEDEQSYGSELGQQYVFRGMDGKEYIQDECGRSVEYNASTGKPCNLTFTEESREALKKRLKTKQQRSDKSESNEARHLQRFEG